MEPQIQEASWLTKGRTGKRWTPEEEQEVLALLEASGESMAAFSLRLGFSLRRVSRLRRRNRKPVAFVEVKPAPVSGRLVVGGVTLEVSDLQQLDPQWIAALARAQQEACG
jgi:transposase-like protein